MTQVRTAPQLPRVERFHRRGVEQREGPAAGRVASENAASAEPRRNVIGRGNIEINGLQLFSLKFHFVRPADELHILNLERLALSVRLQQHKKLRALRSRQESR